MRRRPLTGREYVELKCQALWGPQPAHNDARRTTQDELVKLGLSWYLDDRLVPVDWRVIPTATCRCGITLEGVRALATSLLPGDVEVFGTVPRRQPRGSAAS